MMSTSKSTKVNSSQLEARKANAVADSIETFMILVQKKDNQNAALNGLSDLEKEIEADF